MYGEPEWSYEAGSVVVYDIEHLFGRDLIVARSDEDRRFLPLAIVTHAHPLDWFQQRWARKWAIATDSGDWAVAAAMARTLGEDLATS